MIPSRFWLLVAIMSATTMHALDVTIVNVSLPHMLSQLGATPDSISWVLTSYLVASAVFMPLTGFFTDRLGRKRFLLVCIAGFVIASGLCGIAQSLPQMVAFRLLQGIFGGMLMPLSQAIIADTFPAEERVGAMAIWAMGTMAAPVLGPSLGGFLTEMLSWRWNFYINLPVGVLSLLLAARFVPDTPAKQRDMDWIGFVTLATAIACLQLVLDRGAEKDWFESSLICTATGIALVAFLAFLWKSLAGSGHPMFDLRVLKDRNLAVACAIILSVGLGLYGSQLLFPLFLQNQLGFPAMTAGNYMMPLGLAAMISMSLVGRYGNRFNPRNMVFAGLLLCCLSTLAMTRITPQVSGSIVLLSLVLQGIGLGVAFPPLSSIAYLTVPPNKTAEAAGLYGLMRSFGISIGVSIAATYLNYSAKLHWDGMRGMVNPYSIHAFLQQAGQKAAYFLDPSGLHLNSLGAALMGKLVYQQAMAQAMVSAFWLLTASFVAMMPLVLLIRTARPATVDRPPLVGAK